LILESTPDQKPNTYKCNPLPKTHHFCPTRNRTRAPSLVHLFPYPR